MKKITLVVPVLLIAIAGSVGVYKYVHRPNQSIFVSGRALFPELKKEEMIRQSDTIVVGWVKNLENEKAPSVFREGEEDIVTNATIEVEKYLRNYSDNSSHEIIVETLGGTVGSLSMNFEGAASFHEGERVLVFLTHVDKNLYSVGAWVRGKYTIDTTGNVGIRNDERSYFYDIFGENLTLAQVEQEIAVYKNIAPKPEAPVSR